MKGLHKDNSAQWLLLSAVVVAVALGVLMLLLNTAMLTGHSSSQSIMSFPKEDIRELKNDPVDEAYILGKDLNQNETEGIDRIVLFNQSFDKYIRELNETYLLRGAIVNITYCPVKDTETGKIDNLTMTVAYWNGDTSYLEKYLIVIPEK